MLDRSPEIARALMFEASEALELLLETPSLRADAQFLEQARACVRDVRALRTGAYAPDEGRVLAFPGAPIGRPPESDVAHAQRVLADADAWERYDAAVEALAGARAARIAAEDAQHLWDLRRVRIPRERPPEHGDMAGARERYGAAQGRTLRLRKMCDDVQWRARAVVERVERHPGRAFQDAVNRAARAEADAVIRLRETPDHCSACKRAGWAEGLEQAQAAVNAAHAEHLAAAVAYEEERLRLQADEDDRLLRSAEDARLAGEELACLEVELVEAEQLELEAARDVRRLRVLNEAATTWDQQMRELGARPEIPVVLPPAMPANPRPHADELDAARETLEEAAEAERAEQRRELVRLKLQAAETRSARDLLTADLGRQLERIKVLEPPLEPT